jgi:hypothetical protein
MNSKAPALATWLLEHLVPGEKDAIAGDLVEEFRNGRSRAWFWRQALTVIFLALCSESYRQRSAIVFAMLWAGIISVSRRHLLFASQFQSLVAWGIRRDWPESMVYSVGIFCAVNVLLIWAGLIVYLTIVDGFSRRGLSRGLVVGLLAGALSQLADFTFSVANISLPGSWYFVWVLGPPFFALLFSIWAARLNVESGSSYEKAAS